MYYAEDYDLLTLEVINFFECQILGNHFKWIHIFTLPKTHFKDMKIKQIQLFMVLLPNFNLIKRGEPC